MTLNKTDLTAVGPREARGEAIATHNYSMPWQSQGIKVVLFSNKIHECMSSKRDRGKDRNRLLTPVT